MRLGVDTGGTFTDFVLLEDGRLRVHKVLSTPEAPERAILQGLRDLGLESNALQIVHGSTVATNAVLEGKGVRTAFITNRGLRDILTIGRQARRELYNLQPARQVPPVPEALCLETGGRLGARGEVLEPLSEADLEALRARLRELAPRAVAINLLFSFLDDGFERAIEAIVPDGIFVSRSSAVLPEYREYERGIATWLNASVGPLMQSYLTRLQAALASARVQVMQSSGTTIGAAQAGRQAVHLLLSGPAGGLIGARLIGQTAGRERLLTFDMGGTSTDVALIDGAITLTGEGSIGGYPVAVPMVDMHTIGAGGGSVAWRDAGGLLQVGPMSAGADPGPACYGRGGTQPTVTDANLVLGRLRADAFLGGSLALDEMAARRALAGLAESLRLSVEEAAAGVVRLANEHMSRALRVISVQRGIDPREFTLLSFGGAGGLHVCALADSLGMRSAMVPAHAGVLSALGMLAAPLGRQLSQTMSGRLADLDAVLLEQSLHALRARGEQALRDEGLGAAGIDCAYAVDLRYAGQSYTLTVPWQGPAASAAAFHAAHCARYGHDLDQPIELVNLRVALSGPTPDIRLAPLPSAQGRPVETQRVRLYGLASAVPVFDRTQLAAGHRMDGPALITESIATTYIDAGWSCEVDASGNLLLSR